ncbi:DUF4126 family protein [Streptomyces tagetis]|uniref:DUF4126 family protein n=1 Tax=Streptomyces tagetis TaxID=2820809 RepID=A0A940XA94_9ACTN|nr:DUF4126 family protein [Streptomyces sp. RG38]MBQ0826413.1 DUF4126 family protein [Streptomyces sp. RG38]
MSRAVRALTRAALIGAAGGLRSTWGAAALSWTAGSATGPPGEPPWLARPAVRGLLAAAAAGEFVADKNPATPSRLRPGGLVPRLAFGGLTGVAVALRDDPLASPTDPETPLSPVAGAVGAGAALAAALAGARWRTTGPRRRPSVAPVAAAVEDLVAAALALAACALCTPGAPERHSGPDEETARPESGDGAPGDVAG